jgi:hypothetical protein
MLGASRLAARFGLRPPLVSISAGQHFSFFLAEVLTG